MKKYYINNSQIRFLLTILISHELNVKTKIATRNKKRNFIKIKV